jgi:SpoVK/Ycf46/Vps4 family AAA+-type ATPase
VRSRTSARSWSDLIPHGQVRAELDFIAASIRNREMLKAEGLTIKRALLLSGPPGDGKSAAIECFVNGIAGEATVIIVEAVEHIRAVYHLAQTLAPAVVILEDLDLMTKSRQNPYSYGAISQNDVTGELRRSCREAPHTPTLSRSPPPTIRRRSMKRLPNAPDASMRMSGWVIRAILNLYLDRFGVNDDFTRRRLQQTLTRDLGRLHLVPAHIEDFVKAGIKRARLAQRTAEYLDFEPGIEATKSIATAKQS